jgi:integrase
MRQPKPYFKKSHDAWYANIGPGKRPVKLAEGKANEEAAWDKYHAQMAGRQPVAADCTVQDLAARFLAHHANSAPSTLRFYTDPLTSFVAHIGSKLRVCDLKPYHVSQWLERCHKTVKKAKKVGDKWTVQDTGRPTTDNYRHNLVRAVKCCFRWAEDEEYIDRSPIRKVKLPPSTPRGDEAYLMPDQWDKLVAAIKDQPLLDLITVMKETGCRPQEVRRVEARHFDRVGSCWVFPKKESKGGRESRVVHLESNAFAICQRLVLKNPAGPMFRNRRGNPWTKEVLDYRCYRLSKKLGFRVTPYAIRHTFATDAITALTFGTASTNGFLELDGFNQQVAGLAVAAGATAASQVIGNSSTTTDATLTFDGGSGPSSSFGGTIEDKVTGSGTHTTALAIAGGTLDLTGNNTFSGGTTVNRCV